MNKNIYIGLDVGGANTKVTVFDANFNIINVVSKNIHIWNDINKLCSFLRHISDNYESFHVSYYVTITAESCDNFLNREKGIHSIVEICNNELYGEVLFYNNLDSYVKYNIAIKEPKNLISTNWLLTKKLLENNSNIDLLIDIGSTTTDFIYKDIVITSNLTDYERLKNNTLLYLGVIRTPLPMISDRVSYDGSKIPLVKELFATTGDIFNVTGDINFLTLDYMGVDSLNYSIENSLIRISRCIGLDYNKDNRDRVIEMSFSLKKMLIEKIFKHVGLIFKNPKTISISSVGEGKFLVEDMCSAHKINYINISANKIFNIPDTIDKNLIYCNLPSALVVTNFFNNK